MNPRSQSSALLVLVLVLVLVLALLDSSHGFRISVGGEPQTQRQRPQQPPSMALSRIAGPAAAVALALLLPPPLPQLPPQSVANAATVQTTTAAANLPEDVLGAALVSLGKGASLDRIAGTPEEGGGSGGGGGPALYLTARVGSRGRVLASVRVPLADLPGGGFPCEVQLKTRDVYADTAEARAEVAESIRTQDLVLSARLDKDGQASTRDPEDLVGQGVVVKFKSPDSAQWSRATIELTGRGAFGELVTKKQK